MEKRNPICSIIIRSFNEAKYIGKLMDGIRRQTIFDEIEIILVDSGSQDDTVNIAKEKGAQIIHIKPQEFSFGRSLNIGCEAAKGKYLLMASAHVYPVYTDWIEKMIEPFKQSKVALVYGRQTGNDVTKYSEQQIFRKWFPKESDYNQSHPFCNNANAAIRKDLWEQHNYDETLTGLEDIAWGLYIQRKGYTIVYEAMAPIVHVHEESISKIKNRYMREAIAMKRILPQQKMNFAEFIKLSFGNIISDCFHAKHEGVLFENFKGIVQFRLLQFWGSYNGLRRSGEIDYHLRQRFYYPNEMNKTPEPSWAHSEKIDYQLV